MGATADRKLALAMSAFGAHDFIAANDAAALEHARLCINSHDVELGAAHGSSEN
jgi:hypothetical protein